jgi:hypothetical protein
VDKILQHAGIDAIEYLNFLWHTFVMFLVIAFLNVAVLLPINGTSLVHDS